ncbi:hypothetical protein KRR38_18760 [Novosphingobium sp. G106]|uniref:hypothetical protein n=1 Tax=Novosphingobium sp. G106 TaxID=2849500 RepID=UPI001C2D286C|nr:hypothetical protein [Novosphingobium sp. G106]MBV1689668.1 hypothetical protein [Novosphingobium sp. G106]
MSVRMAIAKLSAAVAGGALIGGGAVHVAEPPAKNPQYVKHVKQAKARRVVKRPARRVVPRAARVIEPPARRVIEQPAPRPTFRPRRRRSS